MLLLPNTIYRSIGLGAILVVVVAVVASLTLLPAVLALLGDRVECAAHPGPDDTPTRQGRFWDRIARTVMRPPGRQPGARRRGPACWRPCPTSA